MSGVFDPTTTNPLVNRDSHIGNQYREYYQKGSSDPGWLGGTTAEGFVSIYNGVVSRDWVVVDLNVQALKLEALGAVTDPVGYVATQLSGWMLEHLAPLRALLHGLAGSPEMIKGYAVTWDNVAQHMTSVAQQHRDFSVSDTRRWHGRAADLYRERSVAIAKACDESATAARTAGTAALMMGEVVGGLRSAVRDVLANLAAMAVTAVIEEAVTGGLATPVVVFQFIRRVMVEGKQIARLLGNVVKTLNKLNILLGALKNLAEGKAKEIGVLLSRNPAPRPHQPGAATP